MSDGHERGSAEETAFYIRQANQVVQAVLRDEEKKYRIRTEAFEWLPTFLVGNVGKELLELLTNSNTAIHLGSSPYEGRNLPVQSVHYDLPGIYLSGSGICYIYTTCINRYTPWRQDEDPLIPEDAVKQLRHWWCSMTQEEFLSKAGTLAGALLMGKALRYPRLYRNNFDD